eukprot:764737-Prymnesium_polylepis.2
MAMRLSGVPTGMSDDAASLASASSASSRRPSALHCASCSSSSATRRHELSCSAIVGGPSSPPLSTVADARAWPAASGSSAAAGIGRTRMPFRSTSTCRATLAAASALDAANAASFAASHGCARRSTFASIASMMASSSRPSDEQTQRSLLLDDVAPIPDSHGHRRRKTRSSLLSIRSCCSSCPSTSADTRCLHALCACASSQYAGWIVVPLRDMVVAVRDMVGNDSSQSQCTCTLFTTPPRCMLVA